VAVVEAKVDKVVLVELAELAAKVDPAVLVEVVNIPKALIAVILTTTV
jgi:hypothetical protein